MSHVREVIELLTRILKDNGIGAIKAECFRAAKFDKYDVTEPLWRLLLELVYILKHGQIEDYLKEFIGQLSQEEMVVYTKSTMQELGYLSREFSNLPDDMSSGSRELLLAIGWLISSQKVVDKLVDLHMSPLDQEFPNQEPVVVEQQPVCTGELGAVSRAQQLQLQNGRLRLSLKTLYSLYREETRLQHRIHEQTAGVSIVSQEPHLSVMEVYLLRHPEKLKRCMKQIEKDNERLESLIQWKEHEHVFWKWMESVLHLKLEEKMQKEEENRGAVVHYSIATDLLGSVSLSRLTLESAILKLEPIITQLEELWETKQHEMTVEQIRKIESAVNSDIELNQNDISADNMTPQAPLYQNSRLLFIKPSQKKLSNVQIPALNVNQDCSCDPVEIQSEITHFLDDINRLECEIRRKERFYRKQLDTCASHIKDAICIQPASLTR